MTLCMVWKTADSIHFVSDSRGKVGVQYVDAAIKVLRIPYNLREAASHGTVPTTVAVGEIGMVASGATLIAMMTKEALVEVVRNMQGVPGHHKFSMDEIASLMFSGFKEICGHYSAMGASADTNVVVAGFCNFTKTFRAFRMEHDGALNVQIFNEVLGTTGDIEYLGSGISIAKGFLSGKQISDKNVIIALQTVIDDPSIPGVGGNIQYGAFEGAEFVVSGVAVYTNGQVHYWRGPLDLNGTAFNEPGRLISNFSYLDLI